MGVKCILLVLFVCCLCVIPLRKKQIIHQLYIHNRNVIWLPFVHIEENTDVNDTNHLITFKWNVCINLNRSVKKKYVFTTNCFNMQQSPWECQGLSFLLCQVLTTMLYLMLLVFSWVKGELSFRNVAVELRSCGLGVSRVISLMAVLVPFIGYLKYLAKDHMTLREPILIVILILCWTNCVYYIMLSLILSYCYCVLV